MWWIVSRAFLGVGFSVQVIDGDFVKSLTFTRGLHLVLALAVIASAASVGGCASTVADLPYVGLPADAPARKPQTGTYIPVHDLPADREIAKLDAAERARLQAELVATRDKQNAAGAAAK